ncbi:MAG: hypothetical protein R6U50_14235 [Desulfobacterales bacterium]
MNRRRFNSIAFFWLITGFSVFSAYIAYIAGGIALESKEGTLLFGFLLLLYLCWFIYDSFVDITASLKDSVTLNLTRNPAVWAMYCYWIAFLILPIVYGLVT